MSSTIYTIWTFIFHCIPWLWNWGKCSFQIPYEYFPSKSTRGNNIALKCMTIKRSENAMIKYTIKTIGAMKTQNETFTTGLTRSMKNLTKNYICSSCSKTRNIVRMLPECPDTGTTRYRIPHLVNRRKSIIKLIYLSAMQKPNLVKKKKKKPKFIKSANLDGSIWRTGNKPVITCKDGIINLQDQKFL